MTKSEPDFNGELSHGRRVQKMSADEERQTARKWYRWLWLSPLLTVPTMLIIHYAADSLIYDLYCLPGGPPCVYHFQTIFRWSGLIAILGSALWHLVLLLPIRNKSSEFISWHGRQGMVLAGVRTAVPLILFGVWIEYGALLAIVVMIPIWLFGTLWGKRQAERGDCSLMRWTGREADLPGPPDKLALDKGTSTERLVNIIRFSDDPDKRQVALDELTQRGVVEFL